MDYKTAGVDVEGGRAFIDRIRASVESTHRSEVIGGLGGFGGCFRIPSGFSQPVLVSGTDGVGTKLELAQQYQAHFGVGVDLVAMCVNDVITSGANPLFFLDYIATGVLQPEAMAEVVAGIAHGCSSTGCALLGGETAEMPGFYSPGRYDIAGFCVGVVEEADLIDKSLIRVGDQIIGLSSSGLHSNGFSLVRKILDMNKADHLSCFGSNNLPLIDELLTPTTLYQKVVQSLSQSNIPLHGMAHITGGGLPENLPRCLPKGFQARVDSLSWTRPEIFQWLKDAGDISERDLWHTFNLGVGFCVVLPRECVEDALQVCIHEGLEAWTMGEVEESSSTHKVGVAGLPD